jgi:hypothetical protein
MGLREFAAGALMMLVSGCATMPRGETTLYFTEQDKDGAPYDTRMRINSDFLRIDSGGEDGFLLLDRKQRVVYSVSRGDRSVLVIRPLPVTLARPTALENRVRPDAAPFPPVAGHRVVHYQLLTNGAVCREVYAADGLLPQAVAALREYHEILAGEQAHTESRMPASEHSDCDLVDFVFAPGRYLAQGFPVRQVDRNGHVRQLINFKVGDVASDDWHRLPADYRHYSISDMVQ